MWSQGMVQGIHHGKHHDPMIQEPFTNPFRYAPHPLVQEAARQIISRIDSSPELSSAFAEGKMLGVLVCSTCHPERSRGIYAFSGNVGGLSHIEGFVPPVFDLLDPEGHFKLKENEISELTARIKDMEGIIDSSQKALKAAVADRDNELGLIRRTNAERKLKRDVLRKELDVGGPGYAALIKESQFEKAELKRAKDRWKDIIGNIENGLSETNDRISDMKRRRAGMSEELQKWIFRQYIVHNALGEKKSILEIFEEKGLVPPGGTGECAAPKLLEYAYRNGLRPIAMGEFWYGRSPETAVRTHGHFYPSCTSKCGPLLNFMMIGLKGIPYSEGVVSQGPDVIYEDQWIVVVEKPAGMPSVPGLDGQTSLSEWLNARDSEAGTVHEAVHRLDMDTSGIMLFAKTPEAAINLRKQFEEHTVRKTYTARLCPPDNSRFTAEVQDLKTGNTGRIELPLSADYDERPRQKVDRMQGKPSLTLYEVTAVNPDGTTDILFHPHTGRTHQLRVHAAHTLGLGRPILGDMLYGGCGTALSPSGTESHAPHRLHLHALSITFTHPATGTEMTFTANRLSY